MRLATPRASGPTRCTVDIGIRGLVEQRGNELFGAKGAQVIEPFAHAQITDGEWARAAFAGPDCTGRSTHAHHILPRSQGGDNMPDNGLGTCSRCHGWVHANPALSYARGWLRRRGG